MSSGAKSGGSGSNSFDYYGSVAGLLGWGPADELVAVVVDDLEVWRPEVTVKRVGSANPYVFDVEGYGRCYFYWGTADQVVNDPVLSNRDHSPHRRRVFIVLENFLFGRERTSAPDIRVIWRRNPLQEVVLDAGLDVDGQANPVAFGLEVLTDSLNGLGLNQELFDERSWSALAGSLAAAPADEFLSAGLTDKTTGRGFLIELAGYFGGWFRPTDEGTIEVGRWREGEGPVGLPVIGMGDLLEGSRPTVEGGGALDADGRVTLTFVNRETVYQDDQVVFNNGARRAELEREDPAEVQRPWIRRGEQAGRKAAESGELLSQSKRTLQLEVMETRATALVPGARFVFERADLDWSVVCRVVRRSGDGDGGGGVAIEAEGERVFSSGIYAGGASEGSIEADEDPEDLDYWQPVQLPASLAGGNLYQLAFLAGRTQGLVTEGRPYLQAAEAEAFQLLGVQRTWAVPFELVAAYPSSVAVDDETGTLQMDVSAGGLGFEDLDAAPTLDEISDDAWLIFLFPNGSEEDFEVLTLRSFVAEVSGYSFNVWRARFGTERESFAIGDRGFVIARSSLAWFGWGGLKERALSGSPSVGLKLVPATIREVLPIADATAKTLALRDQTGEDTTAALESGQTALEAEAAALEARADALDIATADLDARVTALEAP